MKVYLIRHGETDYNKEHRWQGWIDIGLNGVGRAQARELGMKLSKIKFNKIYVSPLGRARETMELALGDVSFSENEDIIEMNMGELQGKLTSETNEYLSKMIDNPALRAPGGESLNDFANRLSRFIESISQEKGNIAVFTHGGVIRMIMQYLLNLSSRDSYKNCEMIVIVNQGSSYTLLK